MLWVVRLLWVIFGGSLVILPSVGAMYDRVCSPNEVCRPILCDCSFFCCCLRAGGGAQIPFGNLPVGFASGEEFPSEILLLRRTRFASLALRAHENNLFHLQQAPESFPQPLQQAAPVQIRLSAYPKPFRPVPRFAYPHQSHAFKSVQRYSE